MVAYNFKPFFTDLVESRQKNQTIRGDRSRHARPGEAVQLFTGMRTKQCRKLLTPDPVCLSVTPIVITSRKVILDDVELSDQELNALAIADGFERVSGFLLFFYTHENCFDGVLIKWE